MPHPTLTIIEFLFSLPSVTDTTAAISRGTAITSHVVRYAEVRVVRRRQQCLESSAPISQRQRPCVVSAVAEQVEGDEGRVPG